MNKKLISLIFVLLFSTALVGCGQSNKEEERLKELEAKIEQMEQEKEEQEEIIEEAVDEETRAEEEAEQARILAELEAAKAEAAKAEQAAKDAANKQPAPARPKFGPGNGNNLQGYDDGWLTIRTNSANGKLTLRTEPDQSASGILEIPNGTSDVYYFNRVKVGEYVWYEVDYFGTVGYLRGDYVDRF